MSYSKVTFILYINNVCFIPQLHR